MHAQLFDCNAARSDAPGGRRRGGGGLGILVGKRLWIMPIDPMPRLSCSRTTGASSSAHVPPLAGGGSRRWSGPWASRTKGATIFPGERLRWMPLNFCSFSNLRDAWHMHSLHQRWRRRLRSAQEYMLPFILTRELIWASRTRLMPGGVSTVTAAKAVFAHSVAYGG